jgi:hypothetical protein
LKRARILLTELRRVNPQLMGITILTPNAKACGP